MFNEEFKCKFINECSSESVGIVARTLFRKTEPFEKANATDLCCFSKAEMQEMCNSVFSMRADTKKNAKNVLKRYVVWAISQQISGAQDILDQIDFSSESQFKVRYVSNPTHLEMILDKAFRPISDHTTDSTFRALYWLAFSGLDVNKAKQLTVNDIDTMNMTINDNGTELLIYPQSMPALRECMEATEFRNYHPTHRDKFRMVDRAPSNLILRGLKGATGVEFLTINAARKIKIANENKVINNKITFESVKLSGLFYRISEQERAGVKPDFVWLAEFMNKDKEYKVNKMHSLRSKYVRIATAYKKDYNTWKAAFSIE